jgi:acyl-CoA reductase-like NAD-dependent aldehyde dehydrogenase
MQQQVDVLDLDLYIDGKWRAASSGERLDVFNPAYGHKVATIARAAQADLDAAVEAARRGLAVWRNTHPAERARIMQRLAHELRKRQMEFAELETLATGGSMQGSLTTINDVCARRIEYYAGIADKVLGDTFVTPNKFLSYTLREPRGVTAHIVPWNGPLWVGSRTFAPALAAGNSIIIMPAMETPLSLLKLAELATECGVPDGVFNVITGVGGELGDMLTAHEGIDAIYFTGSTNTGRRVVQRAAQNLVPVVLELGGKSPNIVMADAPMPAALYGALWAIFANAGQICVAGSRLLIERKIHAEFVEQLATMARGLKLGGTHDKADIGPVISLRQRDRIMNYIEIGRGEAKLITGGNLPSDPALQGGYYVEPTIFDEVASDTRIAREEIFGPVLVVTPFDTVEEAIEMANNCDYGLAAAVWTSNVRTAHLVAQQLESAQVYVNHYFSAGYELSRTPYKSSGYGGSEGPDAINEFLNTKTVSINLQ